MEFTQLLVPRKLTANPYTCAQPYEKTRTWTMQLYIFFCNMNAPWDCWSHWCSFTQTGL